FFFKESLNRVTYISYHNYAHKFILEYKRSYLDINKEPKDVFKKSILNNEMETLPTNERELVFKHLIREKS
ncbi:multidrug transporter, partial [Proteus faecis]|nr:multidrug transporter [Proteus faecis]